MPVGEAEAELRARGSRFLARAGRAATRREAEDFRSRARRCHHDATHHVLAFLPLEGAAWWDDDGEPSGTGGRPVLDAIQGSGLRQTAVVVTRWFGGTRLGTGGLSRAYAGAAALALSDLPGRPAVPAARCLVRFDHPDTGAVMRLLDAAGARRGKPQYETRVSLEVLLARDRRPELARALADATGGRARLELVRDEGLLVLAEGGGGAT
ncbi:MAG: YigZ family protein [Candidatus Palauibacterales bacterium]|nr:YigZ family protein [Candidatus Palauibacterales bacterium]MDP2530543.1 YigZ family protein [Candidatus Palauibacterales bacterium]MDP2582898.1 YigZ family protein [Candidatus Palauibacterales bacterium]